MAVADGMGGAPYGGEASRLALAALESFMERHRQPELLTEAVAEANRAVYRESAADRSREGMGTTLTAAMCTGPEGVVAHVGDSRAYLHRPGTLVRVTRDHSVAGEMVASGSLTDAEAANHPQRHVLTRAVGPFARVSVDRELFRLGPGTRLLLCTDGLTAVVEDAALQAVLDREPAGPQAAEALVAAALDRGGPDNITAVIVEWHPPEEPGEDNGR
ncbi:multitarget phosphorylated protein phosphatase [Candidatus Hydrogenisulfobacillus filiaventi]|uniref:Multitarget phosphorylated protein phosphatase n=1 Tax=Candidatus Hydrogenisulfobacillus filiaventi TaxID=2707344 RepID=A0A6F8ZHM7_9FIRM|nr:multitarget phosphorylated protein phosphatase [Candidatus Hydrogenisulfobacillus filiaventi]